MEVIFTIILFWVVFLIITSVTYFIYIKKAYTPEPFSYLDTYPFKCYKCFTTWSMVASYIMVGLVIKDILFIIFGVTISLLYGYGLYKTEKERFQDDDEDVILA